MPLHVESYLTLTDLPEDCILDCGSGGGSKDAICAHWREELGLTVDRENAIRCLRGYGAWEPEDLEVRTSEDLAEIVLWIACGTFSEYMTECEEHDPPIDPRGERPDDFDPSCGSDIFTLE